MGEISEQPEVFCLFLFIRDWENFFGLVKKFFPFFLSHIFHFIEKYSFLYSSTLIFLSFKKCHICLTKPQGNDNALYSLETVTCLAFLFGHSVFVWGNRHA